MNTEEVIEKITNNELYKDEIIDWIKTNQVKVKQVCRFTYDGLPTEVYDARTCKYYYLRITAGVSLAGSTINDGYQYNYTDVYYPVPTPNGPCQYWGGNTLCESIKQTDDECIADIKQQLEKLGLL